MEVALETAIIAGCIAVATSLIAAGGAIYAAIRTTRNAIAIKHMETVNERSREAARLHQELSKYKEPLASAAYDLQSRIYNIVCLGFIETFLFCGTDREKEYAIANTCFLIGQYLCWSELARQEVQFVNLDNDSEARAFLHLQGDITRIWGSDSWHPILRLFAGEQREIGEVFISTSSSAPRCML